jgi:hypothetical protein
MPTSIADFLSTSLDASISLDADLNISFNPSHNIIELRPKDRDADPVCIPVHLVPTLTRLLGELAQ